MNLLGYGHVLALLEDVGKSFDILDVAVEGLPGCSVDLAGHEGRDLGDVLGDAEVVGDVLSLDGVGHGVDETLGKDSTQAYGSDSVAGGAGGFAARVYVVQNVVCDDGMLRDVGCEVSVVEFAFSDDGDEVVNVGELDGVRVGMR